VITDVSSYAVELKEVGTLKSGEFVLSLVWCVVEGWNADLCLMCRRAVDYRVLGYFQDDGRGEDCGVSSVL